MLSTGLHFASESTIVLVFGFRLRQRPENENARTGAVRNFPPSRYCFADFSTVVIFEYGLAMTPRFTLQAALIGPG